MPKIPHEGASLSPVASTSVAITKSRRSVLLEAMCWTLGFLFAQGLVLAVLLLVILLATFGMRCPSQSELLAWVLESDLDQSFLLVGVPVMGAVFVIFPVIRWREGSEFRQRIGWRIPTHEEVVYSLAMIVPAALIGDMVYDVASAGMVTQSNSLGHLYGTFQGVSYPVLIVALALAPAVLEELVFRGMLGRRLVGRFGTFWGVLMASSLFAAVHGAPAHAIATLPIGILLHVLYLQTGTIWIPVMVHFGNNLLALSMVHFHLGNESRVSPMFLAVLCVYLLLMLLLLNQRTRSIGTAQTRCASS